MSAKLLRQIKFHPYVNGAGPSFTLTTWNTNQWRCGKQRIGYMLTQKSGEDDKPTKIFHDTNFGCHATCDPACNGAILGLLEILCAEPANMDDERLKGYNATQLEFAAKHGVALKSVADDTVGKNLAATGV